MEDQEFKERPRFYVGRSGKDGTTKAFFHGSFRDLLRMFEKAMSNYHDHDKVFARIVLQAFWVWESVSGIRGHHKIIEFLNDSEWRSTPTTVIIPLTPSEEKECICFYVEKPFRSRLLEGFCHGRPIDLANLIAEAMSRNPLLVAIVYEAHYLWAEPIHPVSRREIFEAADDPEWLSSFQTATTFPVPCLPPAEVERKLLWMEKVHDLSSENDEFFKCGMPGFGWPRWWERRKESDEAKKAKMNKPKLKLVNKGKSKVAEWDELLTQKPKSSYLVLKQIRELSEASFSELITNIIDLMEQLHIYLGACFIKERSNALTISSEDAEKLKILISNVRRALTSLLSRLIWPR